ncbi:hypothetical protein DXG03_003902 [Asterophora parasitica]|uniref:Uncharacterized protein n=1 Tax=Asterophora parasitica TaxID=117018 RepID=A0A9P7KEX8_9AGAR|nr:hypothetical protein DXG03_003902 [Asterophora parasitica]
MASLSDQIDRLSRNTRAIRATAAHTAASVVGPFTNAVLTANLGDLIRDIDPSELGLFSLQSSSAPTKPDEISRAEFTGATPLRRNPQRRDDTAKPKEVEPEIYAEAALKCIDRYNAIRPMPRAHSQVSAILERLTLVRENIQSLTETLQQAQSAEGPSLKTLINDEEGRVQKLQARLLELNERKKNATSKAGMRPIQAGLKSKPKVPPAPHPPSSPQEDNFWSTPAAAARTLRFTDNLMDEQVDLGDITTTSFMSPIPPSKSDLSPLITADDPVILAPSMPLNLGEDQGAGDGYSDLEPDDERSEGEDEKTVVYRKAPPESETPEPPHPPRPASPAVEPVPETPTSAPSDPAVKQAKVRINSEVERVMARIWATIGDIIMPGHPFDISGRGTGSKPPRAKETIAHLQMLSALSPSPTSPSASSVSSLSAGVPAPPTPQQILTAHLILGLLGTSPQFSLPLNKAKDLLAAKASAGGGAGAVAQGTTRILYGCVAKRLVKIERGGGEQVVKFDV